MRFSIITVCYNSENLIEKTLKSVASQIYKDYEYIIIDGKSSDNTFNIVKKYEKLIPCSQLSSEPDDGIYDAMNKAILKARGDYLYFLNAGDTFHNEKVLAEVANFLIDWKAIVYGDIIKNNQTIKSDSHISCVQLIFREKMPCHQSMFTRKDILINYMFDISYKVCADREWLIRIIKDGNKCQHMKNFIVCNFDNSGVSSHYSKYQDESMAITRKYGGVVAIIIVKIKRNIGRIIGHQWKL